MARNQKLTSLITGRELRSHSRDHDKLTLVFSDGSRMVILLAPDHPPISLPSGLKVRAVRQHDCTFKLDLETEPGLELQTAEPMASVMLRDSAGVLEYAD